MNFLNYLKSQNFYKELESLPLVHCIWLFGSRARGNAEERSDIDLAISCPLATDKNWLEILEIIENAETLLKIDCVRFDKLPPTSLLRINIQQEGIVLYEKHHPGTE